MAMQDLHRQSSSSGAYGYRPDHAELEAYMREGEARAYALGNRGPIRFGADGKLDQDIVDSYWRHGFYIFENVIGTEELADLERDVKNIIDRLPTEEGSLVDSHGRPALAIGCTAPTLFWSKPLGDPMGGTKQAAGRHEIKMIEPTAADDAPKQIVYLILGSLQFSDACVVTYGHPELLAVAEAINGEDFVPYTDALFIKEPGRGAAVSWHQDGTTHWDSEIWDEGCHGFNFMAQVYGSTPENGVWVVPGTHKLGKIDIKKMVADAGTERLPNAVPIVCKPGDVAMSNRQTLHGSFPNTSPNWRVTVNMGFHRRSSVFGVQTKSGIAAAGAYYDDQRIKARSRVVGYGIDARRQRFPSEKPFVYKPHEKAGEKYVWDDAAKVTLHDYNLLDLGL